jgi:CMP-N-acetylneuraminic acid synthetase
LLAWSIDAARESKLIDRFVVSTEDAEIAELAEREGAEIAWRPAELAADLATTVSVLQHLLGQIDADTVVLLQPTSPVRGGGLVDRAISRFIESGADSLATGSMIKSVEWGTMENTPRQQIKGYFYDDGCVYVHRAWVLRAGRWHGDRLEPMVVERRYNFEVDEDVDFDVVERILESQSRGESQQRDAR